MQKFFGKLKRFSITIPHGIEFFSTNALISRLFPPIRDAAVSAEDEEARRAKLMKLAEEKQKRSRKRGCFEDGNGKRMDDYYDYLYKPPASTVLPVPIMC